MVHFEAGFRFLSETIDPVGACDAGAQPGAECHPRLKGKGRIGISFGESGIHHLRMQAGRLSSIKQGSLSFRSRGSRNVHRLEADMAKAELKTRVNDASVTKFLESVAYEHTRRDCFDILRMIKQITREEPKMWGSSIVGFGSYHYKGKSGREGDWMLTGFSPRKKNLVLYLMGGFDQHAALLK